MPTNDERREVARRLRDFETLRDVFKESNICAFLDVLNVGYMDWEHVCARLADLIEPTDLIDPTDETCEADLTDVIDARVLVREYECSKCGMSWETVWAYDYGYCPYCGRRIENAD